MDTTVRIGEQTHKELIKTRGAFEQTFGVKLSLDDTLYIATSYINVIFEEYLKLMLEGLIRIDENKNGTVIVTMNNYNQIAQKVMPRLENAFKVLQNALITKEKTKTPMSALLVGG